MLKNDLQAEVKWTYIMGFITYIKVKCLINDSKEARRGEMEVHYSKFLHYTQNGIISLESRLLQVKVVHAKQPLKQRVIAKK